ncbi:MAG: serine hydrolase domain-containing protein [Vicinamibacterales bacterium]
MKQAVDNKEIAGINYALVKDGEVAAFEAVGSQILGGSPMRDNTLFRIRSTGKTITAVAMMQLWDQGKWRLDDPITKYLPELANLKVATSPDNLDTLVPASHIPTMHEVMTHTAGFSYGLRTDIAADRAYRAADVLRAKDMKTFVSQVASLPLANQPGERWYCSPRLVTAHTRNAIGAMRGVLGGPGYGFGYGGRVVVDGSTETTPQPNGAFSHFSIDGCWFWVDPTNKLSFVGLIARRGGGPVGGVTMGGEGDAARLVYRALAK